MKLQNYFQQYPELKTFLGNIVDSGELENLSEAEREGMIAELSPLLESSMLDYVFENISDESLKALNELAEKDSSDQEFFAFLAQHIPDFQSGLQTVFKDFENTYAVKENE